MESKKEFIEIVNWEKAQPLMKGENNPWLKMYTSVLDNDCIEQLDDRSYRLATYLWALAARMGTKYLRADTDWLKRRMATFPGEPDLEPLMNVKDIHGKPAPFIRYCDAPGQEENTELSSQESAETKNSELRTQDPLYDKCVAFMGAFEYISARALSDKFKINWKRANNIVKSLQSQGLVGGFVKGKGFVVCARAQSEESRVEETIPYRVSGEKKRENPNGFKNPTAEAQRQKEALLADKSQNSVQEPINPKESDETDESAVNMAFTRTQPTSSFRGGQPQSIGRIIKGDFKINNRTIPWNDGECKEFAHAILDALGVYPSDDEIGAFIYWLFDLKQACLSLEVVAELKAKMIEKARWINSSKCKRKKNPSALLTHIMKGELESRGIRLPDKRASPA